MNAATHLIARLLRSTRGASAVEFALFAPIVVIGFLSMVDVGLAVAFRMELDRNVRAGAQAAITLDNPEPAIETIVRLSAGNPEDLGVTVAMTCFCRIGEELESIGCALFCPVGGAEEEPLVFFAIEAERNYTGPIFGERAITSGTRVQIR